MAIVLPPNRIFEAVPERLENALGGGYNPVFTELKKDAEGRLLSYSSDNILPRKGLIYPSAARHNNIMKTTIVFLLGLFSFRPSVTWLERMLFNFNRLADRVYISEVPKGETVCDTCGHNTDGKIMRSDYMKFEHYNACSQEIWQFVKGFGVRLGISETVSSHTGKVAATVLEYEEVYRMRAQDLFSAINVEQLLKNPKKELRRVLKLYLQREKFTGTDDVVVSTKFKTLFFVLSLALLIPKFRRAFLETAATVNWDKLRLDEVDLYWAMLYPHYDYLGLDADTRRQLFKDYCNSKGVEVIFQ